MVPANRILTVAYGAFSCTLEGFDDPIAAMTEIAEYFRDLAAEDPSFGAGPRAPDLAQVRALAERHARHGVSAEAEGGGIVLRPAAGEGEVEADDTAATDTETEDLPTDTSSEPADDDAFASAFRDDALSDGADPGTDDLPDHDDVPDASDEGDDTLAADLAAILSNGAADPSEPTRTSPEIGETGDAGIGPNDAGALRIRRVRRTDDALATAASIVTPAAASQEHGPAVGSGSGAEHTDDRDILGPLSFDEEDCDGDVDDRTADGSDLTSAGFDAISERADGRGAGDDGPQDATRTIAPSAPDMERLFAATDSRLSGEATSRRLANMSHLKAAVAARRADGPAAPGEEAGTEAYRADLASSVRPRRTILPTQIPRGERPARTAPLMLVSEQRVTEAPETEAPPAAQVKPRRTERHDEAGEQEGPQAAAGTGAEAFERFVADMGATDLPDILEAAARYSARILGQETFTRPALLHLAAEACDDLSREDGLRGFGQLLRNGRIRKVGRGTFALGEKSRETPDADRRTG